MKKTNFFWIGYSDLMTSMFFIMLVLFVLTIGYLQVKIKENERLIAEMQEREQGLIDEKERLEKLLNLEKQFQPLLDDNSFYYLPACKKFVVRENLWGLKFSGLTRSGSGPNMLTAPLLQGER